MIEQNGIKPWRRNYSQHHQSSCKLGILRLKHVTSNNSSSLEVEAHDATCHETKILRFVLSLYFELCSDVVIISIWVIPSNIKFCYFARILTNLQGYTQLA